MSTLKVDGIRSNSASSDAITLASDGTCTANITNNLSNRNLIINGDFRIAQRGTTSTETGYNYYTVDRIKTAASGHNEACTHGQVDVAAGTPAYEAGFRKAFGITNGNQTSTDVDDYFQVDYYVEAQDLASSGWNPTSTSSYLTFSFWIKSSVSQFFTYAIRCKDGTEYVFNCKTPVLSADTWTKVTKTIPGNSNLAVNLDNGQGWQIMFFPFIGTNWSTVGLAEDTWSSWASAKHAIPNATTWWGTNDATWQITGVQLEVGSVATDFEHRTFHDELHHCFRYYYVIAPPEAESLIGDSLNYDTSDHCTLRFPVEMRVEPSFICSDFSNAFRIYGSSGGRNVNTLTVNTGVGSTKCIIIECAGGTNGSQNFMRIYNADSGVYATIAASAEL